MNVRWGLTLVQDQVACAIIQRERIPVSGFPIMLLLASYNLWRVFWVWNPFFSTGCETGYTGDDGITCDDYDECAVVTDDQGIEMRNPKNTCHNQEKQKSHSLM